MDYSLLHIIYKKQRLQLLKSIPIYTYIQKVSRLSLKRTWNYFSIPKIKERVFLFSKHHQIEAYRENDHANDLPYPARIQHEQA